MTLLQIEMATNVTLWHLGNVKGAASWCELSHFLKWVVCSKGSSVNKLADPVEGLCVNCYLPFQVDKAIYHSQDIFFVSCWVSSLTFVRSRRHWNLSFALQISVKQAQRLCIEIDIIGSKDVSFLRYHSHDAWSLVFLSLLWFLFAMILFKMLINFEAMSHRKTVEVHSITDLIQNEAFLCFSSCQPIKSKRKLRNAWLNLEGKIIQIVTSIFHCCLCSDGKQPRIHPHLHYVCCTEC